MRAVEEHCPSTVLNPHSQRFVGGEVGEGLDVEGLLGIGCKFVGIYGEYVVGSAFLGQYVFLVHTGIGVIAFHVNLRQLRSFFPHLYVPHAGHVSVFLRVGDGQSQVSCLGLSLVDHR